MSKDGIRRSRLLKAGLCAECGEAPHRPNRYTCIFCAVEKNKRTRDRYASLTAVGVCVKCASKPALHNESQCAECRNKNRDRARINFHRFKKPFIEQVLNHYGRQCACCGETIEAFLTIDHVNNDGNVQRRTVPAHRLPKWLVDNGFPDGFQILCFNCNCGKHRNGGVCPHVHRKDIKACD